MVYKSNSAMLNLLSYKYVYIILSILTNASLVFAEIESTCAQLTMAISTSYSSVGKSKSSPLQFILL